MNDSEKAKRVFTFGKYKGEYVLDVIRAHPTYIDWVLQNVKWFKLTKEEESYRKYISAVYQEQFYEEPSYIEQKFEEAINQEDCGEIDDICWGADPMALF